MASKTKVLVLGAGASLAYGYPLGSELRQRILSIKSSVALKAGIINKFEANITGHKLQKFQEAFSQSQMYSIDAFLARRTEFASIGKECIAHVLLGCENRSRLFDEDAGKDHWYQYLFNHFARVDWDDLDFSSLSIITFNYDRSLEHYLHDSLQAAYGKSPEEVTTKMQSLRILHIYGAIGPTLPEESHAYRGYDSSLIDPHWVGLAAKSINVIPEGRTNSPALTDARAMLRRAYGICFLGFGFDAINVARLAEDGACSTSIPHGGGTLMRGITGTRLGMTDAELRRAYGLLTQDDRATPSFHAMNCTQVLRETLFLQ